MKTCPYINCEAILESIKAHALDFCDGCRGPCILCPECLCSNRLWAIHCRRCGHLIKNKKEYICNYKPKFLDEWKKSFGLFRERVVEQNPDEHWRGRLTAIHGSILVFTSNDDNGYRDLYLIHPYLDSDPIDIHSPLHKYCSGLSLSGSSVINDNYLFLGSKQFLFQIDLPILSSTQPYKLENHIKPYKIGCEEIFLLSDDALLLIKHISPNKIQFTIWDILNGKDVSKFSEEDIIHFALYNEILIITSTGKLSVIQIDIKNKKFAGNSSINIDSFKPLSIPVFIERRLYLLADDLESNDGTKALLKWETGENGFPRDELNIIMKNKDIVGLYPIEGFYILVSYESVSIYSPFKDTQHQVFRLGNGIDLSVPLGIWNTIIAVPFINQLDSYSISVVDSNKERRIFVTDPFYKIFSAPLLWGQYLFILAQKREENGVKLYEFDLTGKKDEKKEVR